MIIIGFLSGIFKNIIIFTSILLVHELGHFIAAKFMKWEVDKIYFYPYGGFTKFNDDLNKPKFEEVIIVFMGPVFQVGYYLVISNFLNLNTLLLFKEYHYSILFFNLLPIYPLDGGKILNLIFNYIFSFRNSFKLTIFLSYICFFIFIIYILLNNSSISLSLLMILMLLVSKLTKELLKEKFYFNKFLLERYLNNYRFNKIKVVKNLNNMSRDYKHVFLCDDKSKTEKEVLLDYFK